MDSRGGCGGGAIAAGTGCGSDNNNVTITNSSFFDNSSSGPGGAVSGSISGSGTIMWIGTAGHGVLMTKEPAGDRPQFVCGEVEAATCKGAVHCSDHCKTTVGQRKRASCSREVPPLIGVVPQLQERAVIRVSPLTNVALRVRKAHVVTPAHSKPSRLCQHRRQPPRR